MPTLKIMPLSCLHRSLLFVLLISLAPEFQNNSIAAVLNENIDNPQGSTISDSPEININATAVLLTEDADFTINNDGVISAQSTGSAPDPISDGVYVGTNTTISTLTNTGTISAESETQSFGLVLEGGVINTFTNSGTISGTTEIGDEGFGIENLGGLIESLFNTGTISGQSTQDAYGIFNNNGTITNLTNSGTISAEGDNFSEVIGIMNDAGSTIVNLNNSGTISGGAGGAGIANFDSSLITNFINTGTISGSTEVWFGFYALGIWNDGSTITTLTNDGTISAEAPDIGAGAIAIYNDGTITTLTNNENGIISAEALDETFGIDNLGTITTLTNSGVISARSTDVIGNYSYGIANNGTITNITNNGTISGVAGDSMGVGIQHEQTIIENLRNTGTISGEADVETRGIFLTNGGTILTLTNSGTISGTSINDDVNINNGYGVFIEGNSNIGSLINTGTISGSKYGIFTQTGGNAYLRNLVNLQSDLTYSGTLPTYYATIIQGSNYGKLELTGPVSPSLNGPTEYYISEGGSVTVDISGGTYSDVLINFSAVNLDNTRTGTFAGDNIDSFGQISWALTDEDNNNNWDLVVTGERYVYLDYDLQQTEISDVAENIGSTLRAMNTNSAIGTQLMDFNPEVNKSFIAFGGAFDLNTNTNENLNIEGILAAGKRLNEKFSVSGYLSTKNNSIDNVSLTSTIPLIGVTAQWSESSFEEGIQYKLSSNYQKNKSKISRTNEGLADIARGDSSFVAQNHMIGISYLQQSPKYNNLTLNPYINLQYSNSYMDGYSENDIYTQVTYNDIKIEEIISEFGVKFVYPLDTKISIRGNLGVENDIKRDKPKLTGSFKSEESFQPVTLGYSELGNRFMTNLGANIKLSNDTTLMISGSYEESKYVGGPEKFINLAYTKQF